MAKRRQTFERAARKRKAARRANAALRKPQPEELPEEPSRKTGRSTRVQKA